MNPVPLVVARTHPPEYRLHKYWSRKPHNVLAHFLAALLDRPGTVVDPFCGSGVLLREAALQGHRVFGFDLNPVAVRIARTTCRPPEPDAFERALAPAVERLERLCAEAYGGPDVQYVVHQIRVACPGCGRLVAAGQAAGSGRKRCCPDCGSRLRFNLAHLDSTEVEAVRRAGQPGLLRDAPTRAAQAEASARAWSDARGSDAPLTENRRILAFAGMRVSDLFTRRNFSLLADFARCVAAISEPGLREAGRLLLSASAAQCSRLIAFRNNLTTGGPAWSVPGFWVPPVHLETNPALHIRARLAKLRAGFERLAARPAAGRVELARREARAGLRRLRRSGVRADLVFLDPPYGDSVPYLEFSALWNVLLGEPADPRADLSVSDRIGADEAWDRYRTGLDAVLAEVAGLLAPGGRLLVTFNNHDRRAWSALLQALQGHGLGCEFVSYQMPAVVPAKACFSPRNSYQGDLYAVYRLRPAGWKPTRSLEPLQAALRRAAAARGGRLPVHLALRVAAVAGMECDLDADLLAERERLIETLFAAAGDGWLRWRGPLAGGQPVVEDLVRGAVAARLCQGPADWPALLEAVTAATWQVGPPEPTEVRAILAGDRELARAVAAAG